jgi:hypothetical protein
MALLPIRRKACWGFFRPKNLMASAGCKPANLSTQGQHATSRPPKPHTHHCSVYTIINYTPVTFLSHSTLLLLHSTRCSTWWLDPDYPSSQPDQRSPCARKFPQSSVWTEPEISELCVKKMLQFLPYGRSIGSWICLTHKTYTCHTLQCCACRSYSVPCDMYMSCV